MTTNKTSSIRTISPLPNPPPRGEGNRTKFFVLLLVSSILLFGNLAAAQAPKPTAQENCDMFYKWFTIPVEKEGGKVEGQDPNTFQDLPRFCTAQQIITWVIEKLLLFAGSVAVIMIIIGGFRYLTSAGNEEAAEKGKKTLVTSVIGLAAIILAAAIVRIVANTLGTGTTKTPATETPSPNTDNSESLDENANNPAPSPTLDETGNPPPDAPR